MRWTQKLMREVAAEERADLELGARDPLDPYALAESHGIPVYGLADCIEHGLSPRIFEHFAITSVSSWSAMLVPIGAARMIIENDEHPLVRRRSSIAHELGHHLLEHPFDQVILGEDHKRVFNETQEKEAKYISGELLVPLKAAERMAFDGWDNARVAERYGVSEQFAQMQMYGQRVRAAKAAKNFRR